LRWRHHNWLYEQHSWIPNVVDMLLSEANAFIMVEPNWRLHFSFGEKRKYTPYGRARLKMKLNPKHGAVEGTKKLLRHWFLTPESGLPVLSGLHGHVLVHYTTVLPVSTAQYVRCCYFMKFILSFSTATGSSQRKWWFQILWQQE